MKSLATNDVETRPEEVCSGESAVNRALALRTRRCCPESQTGTSPLSPSHFGVLEDCSYDLRKEGVTRIDGDRTEHATDLPFAAYSVYLGRVAEDTAHLERWRSRTRSILDPSNAILPDSAGKRCWQGRDVRVA